VRGAKYDNRCVGVGVYEARVCNIICDNEKKGSFVRVCGRVNVGKGVYASCKATRQQFM